MPATSALISCLAVLSIERTAAISASLRRSGEHFLRASLARAPGGIGMEKQRLGGLDGLRAIAALGVIAFHYDGEGLFYYGLLGIELFFVISGFVILMTIEKTGSVLNFAFHRAARLYPAYWLSVIVAGTILLVQNEASLATVLVNLTMLQSFVKFHNLIDPYWTLAFELWFYVILAAIFACRGLGYIEYISLAWLALMTLARAFTMNGDHNLIYSPLIRILAMPTFGHLFIAGMMLYRLHTGRGTRLTLLVLIWAVFYSAFGRHDWSEIPHPPYLLLTAIIVALVWVAVSRNPMLLSNAPLTWIGRRSYSAYLLHFPLFLLFGKTVPALCLLAPAMMASYRYVERPFQRLSHAG